MSLTVIGTGLWRGSLTLAAMEAFRNARRVVLRTGECQAAGWLEENGIAYETLDDMYMSYDDFSAMYDDMAQRIADMSKDADVAYAVFDLRDESVVRLSRIKGARFVPGPAVDGELAAFCAGAACCAAASDIAGFAPRASACAFVREIDSPLAASEVKLKLMEAYPFDSPVIVLSSGAITTVALDELDRLGRYDHTVSAFVSRVSDISRLESFGVDELRELTSREPNSPVSLDRIKRSLGKLADIDDDDESVISALGDIMLETGLICESAARRGRFSLDDVLSDACRKLLFRLHNADYSQKRGN